MNEHYQQDGINYPGAPAAGPPQAPPYGDQPYPGQPAYGAPYGHPGGPGHSGYPGHPGGGGANQMKWMSVTIIGLIAVLGVSAYLLTSHVSALDTPVDQNPPSLFDDAPQQTLAQVQSVPTTTVVAAATQPPATPGARVTTLQIKSGANRKVGSQPTYQVAQPGQVEKPNPKPADDEDETFAVQINQPGASVKVHRSEAGAPVDAATGAATPQPVRRAHRTTDFSRALAFQRSGDYERAIEYYEKSLAQHPGHVGSYNNLGVVYMQMRDYDKAISMYNEAIALNPDDALAYNNLAYCYMQLRNYAAAARSLNDCLHRDPSNLPALTNMGIVKAALSEFGEARSYLERAVAAHPDDPRAHYNLGNMYRRTNDKPKAMRSYLKFTELSAGQYPKREAQVKALLEDTGSWN